MSFELLKAYTELVRLLNTAVVFACVVAGAVIAGGWDLQPAVFLAALAASFAAAGGYAMNDYFDAGIDRVNRPDRPIPRGIISLQSAWVVWVVCSFAALVLGWLLPEHSFSVVVFWVVGLYFYARRLKRTMLVGNVLVATMTGLTFVLGALVAGKPERALFPFLFAFLVNLAREILKDIEDRKGDELLGATTLPIQAGIRPALQLTTGILMGLIATTVVAFALEMFDWRYLAVIIPTDLLLASVGIAIWQSQEPEFLHRLSSRLKWSMLLGLAAMLIGRMP